MQAAFVMAIALTGLGCQNKSTDLGDIPPVFTRETQPVYSSVETLGTHPYPSYASPSSYSGYYPRSYVDDISDVYPSHSDVLRATLCSFVLGRDPGVTTVREIEASVYGD